MAGKNWGPFTGAQLTMLILGGMATLAVPGSLWAVATSAVSITDAVNGHTGAVSSDRRQFTADTLLEQGVTPGNYFHGFGIADSSGGTACVSLYAPPSGKAAVVRSLRVDVYQNPSPGLAAFFAIYADAACTKLVGVVNPPTTGQYVVPFDPGVATKAGLFMTVGGSVSTEAFPDGYLVPAAQVPAS